MCECIEMWVLGGMSLLTQAIKVESGRGIISKKNDGYYYQNMEMDI